MPLSNADRSAKWRANHADYKGYMAKWRKDHPESCNTEKNKELQANWRKTHREYAKKKSAQWRADNKKLVKKYAAEYYKTVTKPKRALEKEPQ